MILETIVFSTIAAASFQVQEKCVTLYENIESCHTTTCQVLEEHVATDEVDSDTCLAYHLYDCSDIMNPCKWSCAGYMKKSVVIWDRLLGFCDDGTVRWREK